MSAPIVSGRWMAGDANVLSTTISGRRPPSSCAPVDGPGDLADVDRLEQRVGRRFEPDEPGPLGQRLPERIHPAREVDERGCHVSARAADLVEIAIGAAVDVVADDDLLARVGELGDGRRRRRPRGEGEAVTAALECGDRAFEALAGRVLRSGVFVAAPGSADRILLVGRGLVDRRRDRAGQLVGLGPAWTASVSNESSSWSWSWAGMSR